MANPETMPETKPETKPLPKLGTVCLSFIKEIDSLATTLPFLTSILKASNAFTDKEFNKYLEETAIELTVTGNTRKYSIKIEDKAEHDKIVRKRDNFRKANLIVPRSYLIYLVSQYDAFLGNLIKSIYVSKPELLNTSDKSLSYQQLVEFGSIDTALDFIIEKEVETVLRKSHSKQFEWMEQAYSIPLRKGLDCWPVFIESTERRNLFVHNDGIVNNQYLKTCKEHKVNIAEGVALNTKLEVPRSYFEKVHRCLLELSVKLTHVLWRKLFEDDRENADDNLISIVFDLINNKSYHLAIELSEFATRDIKNYYSDETKKYILLNKVLSYKFGGREVEAIQILDQVDWSSCADKYLLAVAVIKEQNDKAAFIMKRIGSDEAEIGPLQYREWPLFKEFIKTSEFTEAYKEIYKEVFVIKENEIPKTLSETPAKAAIAVKTPKPAKTAKAAIAVKTDKAAKAVKTTKPAKAAIAVKTTKPAKAVKTAIAAKTAKP